MAGNPWDADQVIEEHADDTPAPASPEEPWNNDRGVYGSGGAEDVGGGDSPDPEQGKDGQLLLGYDENPDGTKYPVYGLPDTSRMGALGRGAADTAALGFSDEAEAGVEAAYKSLIGGKDFGDSYDNAVDRNRSYAKADEDQHGAFRIAGQLLGGLAIPTGLEGVAFRAGREALQAGLGMAEARALAARAVTTRMVQTGAAGGAAYGAGAADGDASERLLGAGVGAVTGAAGGLALGAAGQALAPRAAARAAAARASPLTEEQKFVGAADRQGIDYLAADRPGALPSQWATSLTNLTLGGIPLTEAAQKVVASAQSARDRVAEGVGVVRDATGAGQRLQRGAQQFIDNTLARGQKLYEAIPIDGARKTVLTNTRDALKYLTTGLESNPELSRLWAENPRLKATLDALTPKVTTSREIDGLPGYQAGGPTVSNLEGGQLSWDDLKRFRTIVGQIVGRPGLESDGAQIEGLRKLYGGLSEDMRVSAAAEGSGALKAFERANSYWNGRQKRISDTLAPIFGKDMTASPEDAWRAISSWSKAKGGDFPALARTIRSLPTDDANSVRATIIDGLGLVSKGRQDAGGKVFSPADFVSHWNDLSPRAKSVLFQGEHRKALEDIATVASGMKASSKFANTSKTGIAIGATTTIGSLSNPILGAMYIAGQFGAGKLLGNPGFAKWMAAYSRKPNPAAALAQVGRLGGLARAEPAIANDVLGFQKRLAEAFTGQPLAASGPSPTNNENDGR